MMMLDFAWKTFLEIHFLSSSSLCRWCLWFWTGLECSWVASFYLVLPCDDLLDYEQILPWCFEQILPWVAFWDAYDEACFWGLRISSCLTVLAQVYQVFDREFWVMKIIVVWLWQWGLGCLTGSWGLDVFETGMKLAYQVF